jgi:polar amino acid transport system substrate-binding protein
LAFLATPLTYEPIGIAVPPGDAQLNNWLGNFLKAIEGSGELELLKQHYFGDPSWIKDLP